MAFTEMLNMIPYAMWAAACVTTNRILHYKMLTCLQCEVKVNKKVNTLEIGHPPRVLAYSLGQRCNFLWNDISPTIITTSTFLPVTLMNTLNMNSGYTRKYSGGFIYIQAMVLL